MTYTKTFGNYNMAIYSPADGEHGPAHVHVYIKHRGETFEAKFKLVLDFASRVPIRDQTQIQYHLQECERLGKPAGKPVLETNDNLRNPLMDEKHRQKARALVEEHFPELVRAWMAEHAKCAGTVFNFSKL